MEIIISIIAFILIFSALILVHEFGHFWMARRAGIRVEEFGFGLPPRMWGKKKGDTLYSVNWIPFGGFVRLFGEDPTAFRAEKSKESFVTKTPWQKTTVVLGGVFMNFVLAWALLTFGLLVGIEPLIIGYDQFKDQVHDGNVSMSPYHVFKGDNEKFKIESGDYIISIDGKSLDQIDDLHAYVESVEAESVEVNVRNFNRETEIEGYDIGLGSIDHKHMVDKLTFVDEFKLYPASRVGRAVIMQGSELLGLEKDDVVLRINENEVLGEADFLSMVYAGRVKTLDVFREGKVIQLSPGVGFGRTLVDRVLPESPAAIAGILPGDVFVSIEDTLVYMPQEVKDVTQEIAQEVATLTYLFERNGEQISFEITPDEGLIGVALSPMKMTNALDVSFYETLRVSSVLKVKKQQVGLLKAPFQAFSEIKSISVLTARMMGSVFAKVFSSGEVPDSVAGPVGIAQMTHMSVQNGFMDVIRFAAILSLSLGVLNILPFPALDGGRFVFIIFEALTGRRMSHKFEAMIHAIGFAVLLLLIVLITWNDIARLF